MAGQSAEPFARMRAILTETEPWGEQNPRGYVTLFRCNRMLKSGAGLRCTVKKRY
jgi:hypothetical protein